MKNIKELKEELERLSEYKNGKLIIPICVDFDSTLVISEYPNIICENDNCSEILKRWTTEYNVGVILDTMRGGVDLDIALNWCNEKDIPLYGILENPNQHNFVCSTKCYGIFSIDDRNIGCPLKQNGKEKVVDWGQIVQLIEPILIELNK